MLRPPAAAALSLSRARPRACSQTLPKRRALSPPSSAASDASFQEQAALSPGSTSGPFSRTGTPLGLSVAGSSSSAPLLEPQPPPPPFVVGPTEAELLELDNWLVGVLRLWGRATYLLSRYRCREAIAELDGLPKEVIRGNVEACLLVGRCWFETIDYIKVRPGPPFRPFARARARALALLLDVTQSVSTGFH
jgi:hypothetical protein